MKRILPYILLITLLMLPIGLLHHIAYSAPANLQSLCYTTNGNNCVPAVAASNSAAIAVSSGTTTQLVALASGKGIYVTSFDLVSTAAQTAKFVYGTGTNCGTGTTDLTGAYGMTTFTVISKGDGLGAILFVPGGNALCITTTTTGALNGSISYAQF